MMREEQPPVHPEILTSLMKKVREIAEIQSKGIIHLNEYAKILRKELEKKGLIKKLEPSEKKNWVCYGIDSSFIMPIPLVIGDFYIIATGYMRRPYDASLPVEVNRKIEVVGDLKNERIDQRYLSAEAYLKEREFAKLIIEDYSKYGDVDTILLDGPIIPLYMIAYFRPTDKEKKVIEMVHELTKLQEKRDVVICGIIKRVRSFFLETLFGTDVRNELKKRIGKWADEIGRFNDKTLGEIVLEPGEYIDFGIFTDSSSRIYKCLKDNTKFKTFIGENRWYDAHHFLLKPARSRQVMGIDVLLPICESSSKNDIRQVLSYINEISTYTGYPDIIDLVDGYVRIDSALVETARRAIIREILHNKNIPPNDKAFVIELLEFADLQKKIVVQVAGP